MRLPPRPGPGGLPPCISWVLRFVADSDADVFHRPVRRRRNLVPGDRPSPPLHIPVDFNRLGDG